METTKETHWKLAKKILRYVKRTKEYGALYTFVSDFMLVSYTDSDWARSVEYGRNFSCYVFHMGLGSFSWYSKKYPIVSLLIAKVDYVTSTTIAC